MSTKCVYTDKDTIVQIICIEQSNIEICAQFALYIACYDAVNEMHSGRTALLSL